MRALIALFLILVSTTAVAAQSALTQHWLVHDKDSTAVIDHSAFTAFLQQYVVVRDDGPNLVRYAQVTPASRQALNNYIRTLVQVPLAHYNRNQQLAYWINLYNATLIDLVLEHYPIDTIADIAGTPTALWRLPVVTIDGMALSLNTIRQQILQPIWREPIVLYGLAWATMGGPELPAIAYTGNGIFLQLRDRARHFVNSPQGVVIKNDRLIVSGFFRWFPHAFGRSVIAQISQLREHAAPALSARLDTFNQIADYKFDWHLNDAAALGE